VFSRRYAFLLTVTLVALLVSAARPSPIRADILVSSLPNQVLEGGINGATDFKVTNTSSANVTITNIMKTQEQLTDDVPDDPDTLINVTQTGAKVGDTLLANAANTLTITLNYKTPPLSDGEDSESGVVKFTLTVTASDGKVGSDIGLVKVIDPPAVPEPSTFVLFGVCTVTLMAYMMVGRTGKGGCNYCRSQPSRVMNRPADSSSSRSGSGGRYPSTGRA
jgi:hypothetical protein